MMATQLISFILTLNERLLALIVLSKTPLQNYNAKVSACGKLWHGRSQNVVVENTNSAYVTVVSDVVPY
jgi:hypothetical protein